MKRKITVTKEMVEIKDFFKDFPFDIHFVGGCVRDLLSDLEPHDYDLFTPARPEMIEAYIKSKGRRALKIGARFGTIAVKLSFGIVEITTYRKETYDLKSRKPNVVYTEDVVEDLKRRDFTINALYMTLDGKVKDRINGLKDLQDKILRTVGNSKHRFQEDPLRILRGIRFITKYKLNPEPLTNRRLGTCRWELLRLSKERIKEEMEKGFSLKSKLYFNTLWYYKIFQIVLPSLQNQLGYDQNSRYHDFGLGDHTLSVTMYTMEDYDEPKYIWAALLHDIAKPYVRTMHKSGEYCNYLNHEVLGADMANDFCIKYKFSNKDREFIVDTIRDHLKEDCWLRKYDNMGKLK